MEPSKTIDFVSPAKSAFSKLPHAFSSAFLGISLALATAATADINVACVGNSITYGYGLPYGSSYPNQLQSLLGDGYNVGNYGVSSMTFSMYGNQSYWLMDAFDSAMASSPDIVVIELGTNDSKFFMANYPEQNLYNYNYGLVTVDSLKKDYRALLDTFANLSSAPDIFATLQPYSNNVEWTITDSAIVSTINPIIKEVAIQKGVNIIDLHTLFQTPTWYLDDSVHPNENGAVELAKIVDKYILISKPAVLQNGSTLQVTNGATECNWYKDGILVSGESQCTLTLSTTGTYKALVKIEAGNDSRIMSDEIAVSSLGDSGTISISSRKRGTAIEPQKQRYFDMQGRRIPEQRKAGTKAKIIAR